MILTPSKKKEDTEILFNELSELVPLAMLGGKIEEVIEQLNHQENIISENEN